MIRFETQINLKLVIINEVIVNNFISITGIDMKRTMIYT